MFINLLRADFEFLSLGISKVSDFNNTNEMNLCAGVYVWERLHIFKVSRGKFDNFSNLYQSNSI